MGEAGVEEQLAQGIEVAKKARMVTSASIRQVIVDTTVMEKVITYPTDSALLEHSQQPQLKAAQRCGLTLRQNCNR
ncbi:hypothetical protein QN362_16450 [Actimicrobium sp. CCC2.4]|uniref:hypothetical protein n=1 Tax=Actimicrobium sp. CCC2.4 TaxID=3048606 RepID=UPI002AC95579|nr:hypothetical protein [Actimicrobium sp. CCC2.4]MEB0136928.1 hypothetical protein [Actimicrobium sp. CCC2.4]WPX32705.1 hypothetical protein RHM62_02300 [Actimicrobium sp. CCC2.4]